MVSFEPLQQELDQLKEQGLYRRCRTVEAVEGGRIRVDGRWLVHLASNSYLGLHLHPRVIAAAKEALEQFGAGAGSARLIGGTFPLHDQLETRLARWKGAEAAVLFPTGYMANLGILTALAGPEDLVIGDRLNHASLIDACRLSRADVRVYPHLDAARLKKALASRRARYRRVLIVTEGVFSMDGDIAPLPEIVQAAETYDAWLLVDDAHGTGVLGETGRGVLEHFGIPPGAILQMGTLSKALGSLGGFLAGPRTVIEHIKNRARSFIYTTASPPPVLAAALEGLAVLQEEPLWRRRLWRSVRQWTDGLKGIGCRLVSDVSQIVPIMTGDAVRTMEFSQRLFEAGVYAPGIRPPTVPAGSSRIRTSLTALHTEADLQIALEAFRNLFEQRNVPHHVHG
ncbi:MAG: 8-amino-7-oxononanoate synthase [Candidatus Omnitrophica bacterium]|nr:8-amino-7-oxononanoate synthase [Candidatus Omnitrophota bacterium]